MEDIEILVSTMNQKNYQNLIDKMHIKGKSVIINQITDNSLELPESIENGKVKFLSYKEKGLSKSRNRAIDNAESEICILADDDMYYDEDVLKKVQQAYKTYPNADIIAFDVDNEDKAKRKKILKQGKINIIRSMKISSVQITFKRSSILNKNIRFKEDFGAGAKYDFGEENIFLSECLRKGMKIYYIPQKIATLIKDTETTWSKEQTKEHYYKQGVIYYEISKIMYPILIIQFVFRKGNLYKKDLKPIQVMKYMFEGVGKYKKELSINGK